MDAVSWSVAGPAIGSAFVASLVEVVEAFTIVLAVGTLRGWRSAAFGTAGALGVLGAMIAVLGPLLGHIPLHPLQLAIGVLLLLFGMGWLRKAILRAAGIIPLHDEAAIFADEAAQLTRAGNRGGSRDDWLAGLTAFKAVLLEGLEVVFIVIAVGAGRGLLWPASLGALAACVAILTLGLAIHKPLAKVPENALEIRRRRDAVVVWRVLDRGRARRRVAGSGSRLGGFCTVVSFGRPRHRVDAAAARCRGAAMTIISDVLKELFSMFVTDARLSLAILLLVATVAILVAAFPAEPAFGGGLLLFGSVAILIKAVRREARTRLRG